MKLNFWPFNLTRANRRLKGELIVARSRASLSEATLADLCDVLECYGYPSGSAALRGKLEFDQRLALDTIRRLAEEDAAVNEKLVCALCSGEGVVHSGNGESSVPCDCQEAGDAEAED